MAAECVANVSQMNYPSVTDRYYTRRYLTDIKGNVGEDQCILFHNNRICVVTIAASHPLVIQNKKISRINFQVTENINRLDNKVSGKGKRGGQWLTETSPLCIVMCEDGTDYTLHSCIKGKLVEINETLLNDPKLLTEKYESYGYIAIVLPKFGQSEPQREALLKPDDYQKIISGRLTKSSGIEL